MALVLNDRVKETSTTTGLGKEIVNVPLVQLLLPSKSKTTHNLFDAELL